MSAAGKRILVTGASTGIGRAVTDYLAQRGDRVYAGARENHDLEALEQVPGVTPLRLDVTQPQDIAASVSKVKEETEKLDGLVNNAGVSGGGPLMEIGVEEIERQFAVNVFGVHRVTKAFFPLILRAEGRVVNMSSVGGRLALPFLGPYVMTKFAIEAYSDSLRRELAPHGIEVAVIQPGNVRTPIWNKTDPEDPRYDGSIFEERYRRLARYFINQGNTKGMPPERIARTVYHALHARRPRIRYLVSESNFRQRFLEILPTRLFDWILKRRL